MINDTMLIKGIWKRSLCAGRLKCSFDHEFKYPRDAHDEDDRRNDQSHFCRLPWWGRQLSNFLDGLWIGFCHVFFSID